MRRLFLSPMISSGWNESILLKSRKQRQIFLPLFFVYKKTRTSFMKQKEVLIIF